MEYVKQQEALPSFLVPLEDYPKWKTIVAGLLQITPVYSSNGGVRGSLYW
jgi:hypothetical protein